MKNVITIKIILKGAFYNVLNTYFKDLQLVKMLK